jgi:hypothetical protein
VAFLPPIKLRENARVLHLSQFYCGILQFKNKGLFEKKQDIFYSSWSIDFVIQN